MYLIIRESKNDKEVAQNNTLQAASFFSKPIVSSVYLENKIYGSLE